MRDLRECAAENKITLMVVDLHTDIADASERLAKLHESVRREKRKKEHPVALRRFDCAGIAPAAVSRIGGLLARWSRHTGSTVAAVNVSVSNYMRETPDLSLGDAPVVSAMCVPMLHHGMGLDHMVASVGDALTLTFMADSEAVPDPAVYAQKLQAAYADLGGSCDVMS